MLPLDPLILACSFLHGDEVVRLFLCSKYLNRCLTSAQADTLFRMLCSRELSVCEKKLFMKPLDSDVYRDWRSELCEYTLGDVKRMKSFWDDLKQELLRQGAGEVVDSLGPRTSKAEIEDFEHKIFNYNDIDGFIDENEVPCRKSMPSALSLMYRFVNGQKFRSRMLPKYGLFGGYSRYSHPCNMAILPLEELVPLCIPVRENYRKYATTSYDFFNSTSSINRDAYKDYQLKDNFVPFAYSHNNANETKIFVVGGSNTICVGTSDMHLLYCHPIPSKSSCPLLDWLEDYVMCFKNDIFRYEPAEITQKGRISNLLALYPLPKPSCQDSHEPFSQILNKQMESMQSMVISNGIEVRAGAVFVPEQSEKGSLNFVYSVRMRFLPEHPSRDPRMCSARLRSRHWRITPYPGADVESVDGPGVIGLYPQLSIEDTYSHENFNDGWFAYQSQVDMHAPGGALSGFIDFDAFDKFGNKYEEIQVKLGEIIFLVPEYIR